jgi:hypothetical protein
MPRKKVTKKRARKEYRAVYGSQLTDDDAAIIGRELERLARLKGLKPEGLTPDEIVDHAAKARSPLHRYFDWGDRAAADKWRKYQARYLVRSVRVVVSYNNRPPAKVQVLLATKPTESIEGAGYRSPRQVLRDPELRSQLVTRAWRDLHSWYDKYAYLPELDSIRRLIADELDSDRNAAVA